MAGFGCSPRHTHFHHEFLESLPIDGRRAGLAQIAVYGDDLIIMPPEADGTFSKRILTCRTLSVLDDLARSGLTDVQKALRLRWLAVTFWLVSLLMDGSPAPGSEPSPPTPALPHLGDHSVPESWCRWSLRLLRTN